MKWDLAVPAQGKTDAFHQNLRTRALNVLLMTFPDLKNGFSCYLYLSTCSFITVDQSKLISQ